MQYLTFEILIDGQPVYGKEVYKTVLTDLSRCTRSCIRLKLFYMDISYK